jgi:hypothetical protein
MNLEKIITLANANSRLRFLAMVRSLRATGSDLPVWVIPYDEQKFELPAGCIWWEIPVILNWTTANKLWPAFRKIQCFSTTNYQFVDSDVIFLKEPSKVLKPLSGFVTCCTHWNNPDHTVTSETLNFLRSKTTTWQRLVFNSGQWACDRKLYKVEELINICEHMFRDTLFDNNYLYKDQAGINLLVNLKDVEISNLTLPPYNLESSWAGDYKQHYSRYWNRAETKPYLLHWAGCTMNEGSAADELFFGYLDAAELAEWHILENRNKLSANRLRGKIRKLSRLLRTIISSLSSALHQSPSNQSSATHLR